MYLKAISSRLEQDAICMQEPFAKRNHDYNKYTFQGGFVMMDDDTNERIAIVQATFFDEAQILNDGEDMVDLADMENGELYEAIAQLHNSRLLQQECDPNKEFLPLFTCYIERVYVYPSFRGKGIGKYIFANLSDIFEYCFNSVIHCFVIYPKPLLPDNEGGWLANPDEDGKMKKCMVSVIEKSGYQKLGDSGHYALNAAAMK